MAKATGKPSVLLCDRGVIDGSAYMSRELWLKLLETVGQVPARLFPSRKIRDR